MKKIRAIVVGTSAGGVSALQKLFEAFDNRCTFPIVVVQHIPAHANINLSMVFGSCTNSIILEATDKMLIRPGHIYFAPPDYHLLIEKDFSLALSQDDEVHYSRPSIDVLFDSAAIALGPEACGILMTGANSDGATGLKHIQVCGGTTLVQDLKDAESPTMPGAALAIMKPDFVGSVASLATRVLKWQDGK